MVIHPTTRWYLFSLLNFVAPVLPVLPHRSNQITLFLFWRDLTVSSPSVSNADVSSACFSFYIAFTIVYILWYMQIVLAFIHKSLKNVNLEPLNWIQEFRESSISKQAWLKVAKVKLGRQNLTVVQRQWCIKDLLQIVNNYYVV